MRTLTLLATALPLLCAACAAPLPVGQLYTDIHTPVAVGSGDLDSPRHGEAVVHSFLGLIAIGDGSVEAAARAGGITEIHSAEVHAHNILGFVGTYTTVVRGKHCQSH